MSVTINGTSGLTFNDASTQATSAIAGTTYTCYWANGNRDTAGRDAGTVYQNTSGKTRFVLFAYQIYGQYMYLDAVNGSTTRIGYNQAGGGAPWNTTFIVVPNGYYYQFAGSNPSVIYSWTEWQ
jgi:hypothetical protein